MSLLVLFRGQRVQSLAVAGPAPAARNTQSAPKPAYNKGRNTFRAPRAEPANTAWVQAGGGPAKTNGAVVWRGPYDAPLIPPGQPAVTTKGRNTYRAGIAPQNPPATARYRLMMLLPQPVAKPVPIRVKQTRPSNDNAGIVFVFDPTFVASIPGDTSIVGVDPAASAGPASVSSIPGASTIAALDPVAAPGPVYATSLPAAATIAAIDPVAAPGTAYASSIAADASITGLAPVATAGPADVAAAPGAAPITGLAPVAVAGVVYAVASPAAMTIVGLDPVATIPVISVAYPAAMTITALAPVAVPGAAYSSALPAPIALTGLTFGVQAGPASVPFWPAASEMIGNAPFAIITWPVGTILTTTITSEPIASLSIKADPESISGLTIEQTPIASLSIKLELIS